MSSTNEFATLGLPTAILSALAQLGYEQPSPIQAQSIPELLAGRDLIAQAQTGTGKTAAFALPILTRIVIDGDCPQALVLAPTRELAIQVAEAFQSYAKGMSNFRVVAIYGGQEYRSQLQALKRGVHVVVGTPGRVMDHLRRGTLKMNAIKTFVLDEADEMLRMGFIDDVQWILDQVKHQHQTALFSATMPSSIRKIAQRFLKDPAKVQVAAKVKTVAAIEQAYMQVTKKNKVEALCRYLETEETDAVLVFAGTKLYAAEVADRLAVRGYSVAALHGDMSQSLREKVIQRLKAKKLDIVVATEVAARGLDVERVSHVINLDIPQAAESYIHRIGRTGRAGRTGKALLFVTAKEQRMLKAIEATIGQQIQQIKPTSVDEVKRKRIDKFNTSVVGLLTTVNLDDYREMVQALITENDYSALDVAAALAHLGHKDMFNIAEHQVEEFAGDRKHHAKRGRKDGGRRDFSKGRRARGPRSDRGNVSRGERSSRGGRDGNRSSHSKRKQSAKRGQSKK